MARTRLVRVCGVRAGWVDPNKDMIAFSLVGSDGQSTLPLLASAQEIEQIKIGLDGLLNGLKEVKEQVGTQRANRRDEPYRP